MIGGEDSISRCIIYARAFEGEHHTDRMLWPFESERDGYYHESGVARSLAPSDDEVHRIGCKIAAIQNDRRGTHTPGKGRRYYCGFRTASCKNIPLTGNGFKVSLVIDGEGGEESHVDVRVSIDNGTRGERATYRTNAALALAEPFGWPICYTCECDAEDECHPFIAIGPDCLTAGLDFSETE